MKTRNCLHCGKETTNGIYCNNDCRVSSQIEEERDEMIFEKEKIESQAERQERQKWEMVDHKWESRFD